MNTMLDQIMKAYDSGKTSDADDLWVKADPHFNVAIQACTKDNIYDEYKALDKYTKSILNGKDADKFMDARYKKYKAMIDQRSGFMLDSWKNGNPFNAGYYDGQIAQYMGLVKSPYDDEVEDLARDVLAPAKFLAGWLYGVSGQTIDTRDALTECFKADEDLMNDVYDGMQHYFDGEKSAGDKDWIAARKLFPHALADCDKDITDALTSWSKKMDEMIHKKEWDTAEDKIYQDNKTVIDWNNSNSFTTWNNGVPFQTGMFTGANDKIFLDATKDLTIPVFHPIM